MRISSLILACLLTVSVSRPLWGQIDYPDFTSTAGLNILGDAARFGTVLRLTPSLAGMKGGAWYATKQPVAHGFVTTFQFRISETGGHRDPDGFDGGEGFAFVMQNSSPEVLGGSGATLGYHGIPNSLAIEFDTWNNSGYNGDPNHNHIGVHTRGRLENDFNEPYSLKTVTSIPDMSNGEIHTATVEYRADTLNVFLDDCARPVLSLRIDLDSLLDLDRGRAWLGFTATTASAWENHDILSWRLRYAGIEEGDSVSFCDGEAMTLSAPPGYAEYEWSTGQLSRTIRVSVAGDYRVAVNDPIGCAGGRLEWSTHVSLLPKPSVAIEPDESITFCQGDARTLRAYSTDPDLGYRWSTDETTPEITVREPGVYTVTVTNSAGCSDTESVMVDVLPPPTPHISAEGSLILCDGDEVVLTADSGYAVYRWSTGETTRSIVVRSPGMYTVEVTDENGCSGTSDAIRVAPGISQAPILSDEDTIRLCPLGETTLDAGPGFSSYRWSTGDTTRSIVARDSGRYWVTIEVEGGCRGTSDTVTVVVRSLSRPTVTSDGPGICDDDGVRLTASDGFLSYLWSTGETTKEITVHETGVYSVTVVDSNGCEAASEGLQIDRLVPMRPAISVDGSTTICQGSALTLTASDGFASYLWSTGERVQSIMVDAAGTYEVTAIDSSGCIAVSEPTTITLAPRPTVDAGENRTICGGDTVELHVSTIGEATAAGYRWEPADGLSCADCPHPIASPSMTTTYFVTATTVDGCAAQDSVMVTVDRRSGVVHAHIPRDLHAAPGSTVMVPVMIDQIPDGIEIHDMTITLDYDPQMLQPSETSIRGTAMDGWNISTSADGRRGSFVVRATAPPNEGLAEPGVLIYIGFRAFLGDRSESDVELAVAVGNASCLEVRTSPGLIRIDSVCGLSLRLIEIGDGSYALEPNRPNPFNPSTELPFAIGLDGPTRLEIFDANGRRVALLVDEVMGPGLYTVTWDGSYHPSGMYYCRLTSGTWSAMRVMMLVK